MTNEKMYSANEICEELNISSFTLTNWYIWEKRLIKDGDISEPYLPQPIRVSNLKGRPRQWTAEMLEQLKDYKSKIVLGRNGIYGKYSNPMHEETKKYKKSLESVDSE